MLGPDLARRAVSQVIGNTVYDFSGRTATVYTDANATVLANIATYDPLNPTVIGATIANSQVTLSARDSRLPLFWFPDGVDTLYVRVSTLSHVWQITADVDARLDAVGTVVSGVSAPTGVAATDMANIQAAINALPTSGGIVQMQAGTYVLPVPGNPSLGCVNVGVNNTVFAGAGMGVTELKLADGASTNVTGIIRTPSGVQNSLITFRDFTVNGNKANKIGTPTIIGAFAGVSPMSTQTDTDILFLRVEIKNCTDYGFDPHERVTRLRIIDCISHDNDMDGFTLDGIYDFEMAGCSSYSNGRHGYNLVTGTAGGRITDCQAYGNGSNGFTAQNGAKQVAFTNCRARNNTGVGFLTDGVPQSAPQLDVVPGGRMTYTGCTNQTSGGHGWQLNASSENRLIGCESWDASQTTNAASSHYRVSENGSNYATRNTLVGCTWGSTAGNSNNPKYGVDEQSTNDGPTYVIGCSGTGTATGQLNLAHPTSAVSAAHNGTLGQHPATFAYANDSPTAHGLIEWNYPLDLLGASAGNVCVSGTIYGLRVDVQAGVQLAAINVMLGTAASGLTAGQCVAVVISSSGVELARTGDISGLFGTTGPVTLPLTAAFTPAAGAKLCVLLLFVGTTPPALVRSSATSVTGPNLGLSTTSPRRYFVVATGQTAVSTPVTMTGTTSTGAFTYWVGLS